MLEREREREREREKEGEKERLQKAAGRYSTYLSQAKLQLEYPSLQWKPCL